MAKFCVAFETAECIEKAEAFWAVGLDSDKFESFDFYKESPKQIIENNRDMNLILGDKKLSDELGETYCMKIINKDEDLLKDCETYGWEEVVNDVDRDKFLRDISDLEDEYVINGFFEQLGYFIMTVTGNGGWYTLIISLELREKEHLKEDIGNIYNNFRGCYEVSITKVINKRTKEAKDSADLYYTREPLCDKDVENVLNMKGFDLKANKFCVESNEITNNCKANFKKYRLASYAYAKEI